MRISCFIIGILWITQTPVLAQTKLNNSALQIGIGMNANAYLGDLNYQDESPFRVYPGINFSLQFDNTRRFGVLVNSGFARFVEQYDSFPVANQEEYQPNRFVQSSFFYLDVNLRYFFLRKSILRPFVATGIGILSFDPEDQEGNSLVPNIFSRLPEEDTYLTLVAQVPVQVGVFARINEQLGLKVSGLYRLTMTDYLDNISQFGTKAGNDALLAFQAELLFSLRSDKQEKAPRAPKIKPEKGKPFVMDTHDFLMIWEDQPQDPQGNLNQVEPVHDSRGM